MRQVHAAIAVFAGWATIPLGAVAGWAAMQLLSLNVVDRPFPLQTVYGISAAVVVLVFLAAALLTVIPLAGAVLAMSPSGRVIRMAAGLAVTGVVLLPDELGRVFGFPILAGAAAMGYGGRQLLLEAAANGVGATAGAAAQRSGQTSTGIFGTAELASDETQHPAAALGAATDSATSARIEPTMAWSTAEAKAAARPGSPASGAAATGRRKATRKAASNTVTEKRCQWCSALVPVSATVCPACKAPLDAPDIGSMAIPGVTEVSPELRAYAAQANTAKKRSSILKAMFSDTPAPQTIDSPRPSDAAALRPPSPELRAEMARLDAEIAARRLDSGGEDLSDTAAGPPEAAPEGPPEART